MLYSINQSRQKRFNQSRLSFLFRRAALAQLITQPHPPSPWNFFNTYFASWWWNRLWFRSQIDNPASFDAITQSMRTLKNAGIYNELNCNAVATHANPGNLAQALSSLARANLLTDENRRILAAHQAPLVLVERTLESLRLHGILDLTNFAVVAAHGNTYRLAAALSPLQEAGILNPENRDVVAAHADPYSLAAALSRLQGAGILTKENLDKVADHANPEDLAYALSRLQEAGILTKENREIVAAHADPYRLAAALSSLQRAGILTKENRDIVAAHTNPEGLARALSSLQRAGILTPENRDVVAARANPVGLADVLSSLQRAGILTQANFDALLAPNHAALFSDQACQRIWDRMPRHLLNQDNFQRLLTAAEHANPMAELQRVVDLILEIQARAGHAAADFNPSQSTHTASVHRSVSASATKLMHHYGRDLNFEAAIQAIKEDVGRLEDSPKHQAAKRCIERITKTDYAFTDTSSRVSTRRLLALAYTAIHDEAKREGSLEDAKAMFIEGLYEIQRGYNLDASGVDDGAERDGTICSAGTFNKILEKLNGIHSDVELYYITREGASSKFPKLAQEHALAYLKAHLDAKDTPDLLARIKEEGTLEPIWDVIKDEVKEVIWEEFAEAYENVKESADFLALLECGCDVDAPDLSEIEALLAPKGVVKAGASGALEHKEDETQTPLERHGLWASLRGAGESSAVAPLPEAPSRT